MHKLIVVFVIAAVVCLSGCNKSSAPAAPPKDALEERLRKLAGSGAKDCGRISSAADTKPAGECAMQAAQSKKPFYVAYDMPGLSVGIAGNSAGKLNTVQAQAGDAQGNPATPNLTDFPCPAELRIAQSGRATCTPPGAGMGMGGGPTPHGNMAMPPAGGANSPGGGMAAPPGTPNPHGSMTIKPGMANSPDGSAKKSH